MPIAFKEGKVPQIKDDQNGRVAEQDIPEYKAWRRQPTEPLQDVRDYTQDPYAHQELPSPMRKPTKQPQDALKEHYYQSPGKEGTDHARDLNYRYRKDDQIFPHLVSYSPGKNEIVHTEKVNQLFGHDNPIYRQVNDDRIQYTDPSMDCAQVNRILAEERKKKEHNKKVEVLYEEQHHAMKTAELEDRFQREQERRRDYKKQMDDYSKILGEERLQEAPREKADAARERVYQEAEQVRQIDLQRSANKKDLTNRYAQELNEQRELQMKFEAYHKGVQAQQDN